MSSKPSGLPDPEKPASWVLNLHGERTLHVAVGIFFIWAASQIHVKVVTSWNDHFIRSREQRQEARREIWREEARREIRLLIDELKAENNIESPSPTPAANDLSWGNASREALEKVHPGSEDAPVPSRSPSPSPAPAENEQPSTVKGLPGCGKAQSNISRLEWVSHKLSNTVTSMSCLDRGSRTGGEKPFIQQTKATPKALLFNVSALAVLIVFNACSKE